jgi:hypothetical protein
MSSAILYADASSGIFSVSAFSNTAEWNASISPMPILNYYTRIKQAITQKDINEYVSHYSAPGAMRAGFEYYRAFPQDTIENENYSKTKLTMPVLAVGGEYYPAFGGNVTINYTW